MDKIEQARPIMQYVGELENQVRELKIKNNELLTKMVVVLSYRVIWGFVPGLSLGILIALGFMYWRGYV